MGCFRQQEMVSEGAPPATLGRWLVRPASPTSSRDLRFGLHWTLEKCEEIKLGVEVGTPPRSTAPRAPLLFRHVQFHVRSRFLKNRDGFCNAWVPEALPLTLGVGGGCRIFVGGGGELAFPPAGKAGSGGRNWMFSASSTAIHWSLWAQPEPSWASAFLFV